MGRIRAVLASRGFQGLVVVAFAGWALVEGIDRFGGAEALGERWGDRAAFVTVPVQAVVAVSPVPGEIVAFLNIALYGFWVGAALSWLGWMLAAFLEYGLVRRFALDVAPEGARERLPRWLQALPTRHPAYLICARWLPFGSHLVNSTAGLHGVPMARFSWTTAVSLVPASLVFSAVASGLLSLG